MSHSFIGISEMLARNGRMFPEETALVERSPAENRREEITWREFDRKVNRFSHFLLKRGVGKCASSMKPGKGCPPGRWGN